MLASLLLRIGALTPIVYYGVLIAASLAWPGLNHMTTPISDLGTAASPQHQMFNYGLMATGGLAILGGLGALLGMRRLGSGLILPVLAFIAIALGGAALIMAGLHPLPDALHHAHNIGLALLAAPLLMFLGLSDRSDMSGVKTLLILSFLGGIAALGIMMNWGHFNVMTPANSGLIQRAQTLAVFPWMGLAFLGLAQRLAARERKKREGY